MYMAMSMKLTHSVTSTSSLQFLCRYIYFYYVMPNAFKCRYIYTYITIIDISTILLYNTHIYNTRLLLRVNKISL